MHHAAHSHVTNPAHSNADAMDIDQVEPLDSAMEANFNGIPPTKSASWQAHSSPVAIPEILTLTLAHLDRKSLVATTTVARVWSESAIPLLWRSLLRPPLTPAFFSLLAKNGHHVQHLDLVLNTENETYAVVPMELTRILKVTPRIKSLVLQLSHGAPPETISSLLRVITAFAASLNELALGIGEMNSEDATEFFSSLTSIKKLELIRFASSDALRAIAEAQRKHPTGLYHFGTTSRLTAGTPPGAATINTQMLLFDDASLSSLASRVPGLKEVSVVNNITLTATGLVDLASHCKGLTRLRLDCCMTIAPVGFEYLFEACTSLKEVRLGHTQVQDDALVALSTPASRAANLQILCVSRCRNVTSFGIRNIVEFCDNLVELDISLCSTVSLDVFEDPAWTCSQLEILKMDFTFRNRPPVTNNSQALQEQPQVSGAMMVELTAMYRQIGRLARLKELHMGGTTFDLKLFEFGRKGLEALARLKVLKLRNMFTTLSNKEIIWLTTRFPSLRKLEMDKGAVNPSFLKDLEDINGQIEVVLIDRYTDIEAFIDHMQHGPASVQEAMEEEGEGLDLAAPPLATDSDSDDEPQNNGTWGNNWNTMDTDDESIHTNSTMSMAQHDAHHDIDSSFSDDSSDHNENHSSHYDDDDSSDGEDPHSIDRHYSSSPPLVQSYSDSEDDEEREYQRLLREEEEEEKREMDLQQREDEEEERLYEQRLREMEEEEELEYQRMLREEEEELERDYQRFLREEEEAEGEEEEEEAEEEEEEEETEEEEEEAEEEERKRLHWKDRAEVEKVEERERLEKEAEPEDEDEDADDCDRPLQKKPESVFSVSGVVFTTSDFTDEYDSESDRYGSRSQSNSVMDERSDSDSGEYRNQTSAIDSDVASHYSDEESGISSDAYDPYDDGPRTNAISDNDDDESDSYDSDY
ncbi:hypothetical protein BC939DRAFT_470801 [Gamsiella multidivaricata]|uniref:uncharacterized protein n=1 Tax=Gamsiella multidivaricata TaxID=101098 RepID=UPI00221F37FE|nr:uncharacterized protein BC939DRAFT_470801 [Gamsiella multidivaricata]KAI7815984.1 hypothetical protein BC939DRAFT_470801 [Gamsiella multidivaricata]